MKHTKDSTLFSSEGKRVSSRSSKVEEMVESRDIVDEHSKQHFRVGPRLSFTRH